LVVDEIITSQTESLFHFINAAHSNFFMSYKLY